MNLRSIMPIGLVLLSGCAFFPEISHQPSVHNPFPQLARVAITPFFNHSNEATLDTRHVAEAYFNELQLIQGFEVVPVSVVEAKIREHRLALASPADARRLAQLLRVDAVVIGAVTDYSPYYPPRMGLVVEWFAANPGFHPIPPGYGLPWGTQEEQDIPGQLIFEAEFALAQQQLKTQTPPYAAPPDLPPPSPLQAPGPEATLLKPPGDSAGGDKTAPAPPSPPKSEHAVKPTGQSTAANGVASLEINSGNAEGGPLAGGAKRAGEEEPAFWPDARGFVPAPPRSTPPNCWPIEAPVMRHARTYNGHDAEFTQALETYYISRDDARLDGWQGYLQRSDDFIRFCCRMHIWEMLNARGGAGESRVVWRWPTIR